MIDIKEVVKNPEEMKKNVEARNVKVDVDKVLELYKASLQAKTALESYRASANEVAKQLKQKMSEEKREVLIQQGKDIKAEIAKATEQAKTAGELYQSSVTKLPNWMSEDVPNGKDDADNVEISRYGNPTQFDFTPKDHLDLGESLDLIDFKSGTKVAGTKFYFLKNEAVLLQHAIKSFAFRKAIERGFICLQTPDIAKNSILQGVGFAPRGEESNTYELSGLDMSLVATSEIAVAGMHSDEILDRERLPLLYVAESHCFRREGGTAGRASKGLYRVHQFEKVELFAFTTPEQSEQVHKDILALEESIYQDMKIPYRVVNICSGDLGAPAYKKYDIEAWLPGKGENGEYGEVTSTSNCTTYQARRLNIRFKDPVTSKNAFVHTLNGTAVALSRTPIAIIENYQTKEGGIKIPEVLVPYLGFDEIKPKRNTPNRSLKNPLNL